MTKFLIVIGFPRAYWLRNRCAITWLSNYRYPIGIWLTTRVITYRIGLHSLLLPLLIVLVISNRPHANSRDYSPNCTPFGPITREVKHDVYGKRQTAKMKLLLPVFSSLYSRIKIFVSAVNSKRHFSIFV